jgi:phosphohistidine phosphatase
MNLILWRHADADNFPDRTSDSAPSDLARELTPRGQKQAEQTAKWLKARLPEDAVVLCSPAARTLQTAKALTHDVHVVHDLAPGADVADVLAAAGWPDGIAEAVVVVGHQPTLGRVAALLLSGTEAEWTIKKSGVWWMSNRRRGDDAQVVLRAVVNPDLL